MTQHSAGASALPPYSQMAGLGTKDSLDRQFYHQPNEFGEDVAAAARMVLKLFGGR
tara:strand:- start:454 stop:621 length:168 start_codon:yes stop_codon:yes gene_type:complete